jgi:ribosome-binding factor A
MVSPRGAQLADRIGEIVAELLERRVKDPRLGFVTVTDVRMSGDNQHATVFYTVLGDDDERQRSSEALSSATGMIRSEVGKQLQVRHTPSIEFVLDAVPEVAQHLEDALRRAKSADARIQRENAGAGFAGESDPYRRRDEDEA